MRADTHTHARTTALVTEDTEKTVLLSAFSVSVYTAGVCPDDLSTPESPEETRIKEEFVSVDEDWVMGQLSNLDIHESMGPDGIHPRMLRELVEVIARLFSITGKLWGMGELPEGWRKANVTSVLKKGKMRTLVTIDQLASPPSLER